MILFVCIFTEFVLFFINSSDNGVRFYNYFIALKVFANKKTEKQTKKESESLLQMKQTCVCECTFTFDQQFAYRFVDKHNATEKNNTVFSCYFIAQSAFNRKQTTTWHVAKIEIHLVVKIAIRNKTQRKQQNSAQTSSNIICVK